MYIKFRAILIGKSCQKWKIRMRKLCRCRPCSKYLFSTVSSTICPRGYGLNDQVRQKAIDPILGLQSPAATILGVSGVSNKTALLALQASLFLLFLAILWKTKRRATCMWCVVKIAWNSEPCKWRRIKETMKAYAVTDSLA